MGRLGFFCALLAAGCDPNGGGGGRPQPVACGSTSGAVQGALAGCQAVSIESNGASLITLTNNGFTGTEGDLGTTVIQLAGFVGTASYKAAPTVKSFSSTLTRGTDGRTYHLSYDASNATKPAGTMTLAVSALMPHPGVSIELDLHGHFSATYVPPAGVAYTETAQVEIDF